MIGSRNKWRPLSVREGSRWQWIKWDMTGPLWKVKRKVRAIRSGKEKA